MKRLRFKPISDGISVGDLYGDSLEIYDDGKPDPKTPDVVIVDELHVSTPEFWKWKPVD